MLLLLKEMSKQRSYEGRRHTIGIREVCLHPILIQEIQEILWQLETFKTAQVVEEIHDMGVSTQHKRKEGWP